MKKMHGMMLAAVIAAGCAAPAAMAQDHDHHDDRGGHGMQHGHGPKYMPPGQMRHEDDVPPRWADQPRREWHKGDRLPPEFRDRQYVIDDWRGYHLSPPPRGYQWVGVGGDHLLVQIGSGIVLRIGD
ncbi:RcnB family protein [Burkholderia seminalis]|uniref:RcnB family protein n=1 Tax=Burkholderia seminalis TaxID=488731 RepID=UPI001CF2A611|nr:RcnB family protein [Burkholderia seminalis]MCA7952388.1 RcnB family protein [Burkholderia seminalis]